MKEVLCFGCGALVPDQHGPVHKYMLSAPGCWATYGPVLAWHAGLQSADPAMSQHMVDAYAAQHATNADRRNRQSVAVHLMSLCAALEHRVSGTRLPQMIGSWTHRDYPQLVPRPSAYPITIREVADVTGNTRLALIGDWAASTWSAWSAHHITIRTWLAAAAGRGT